MRALDKLLTKFILLLLSASLLIACGGKEERKAKYMERGKSYLAEKNYDKAKIEFKNVLQIDPKDAEAFMYLGEVSEKKQTWRKAFGSYKKAVELDPELLEARVRLATFYMMQGNSMKAQENLDGAANAFGLVQDEIKEVLAREPQNPEALTLQAVLWDSDGEVDRAQSQLEKILQENPGLNTTAVSLASIYLKRERPGDAEKVLVTAIENSDDKVPLQLRLSQLYVNEKQNDKAERMLQQIIAENPDELSYRLSLASFLSQTDQADKAEQVLRQAIEADPADAQRYILLASLLEEKQGASAAEAHLKQSIAAHPEMAELQFALVPVYVKLDKKDEAIALLEALIEAEGTDPDGLKARTSLAQILASDDVKSERARVLVTEVLEENPRDNAALTMKGKFAANDGDYTDAIASFRSVLRDQPDSIEVLRLLSAAHLANNEPELARDTLVRGVERNPEDLDLKLTLASMLTRMGDIDGALAQVDDVLDVDQYHEAALAAKYELLARKGDAAGMDEVTRQMQAGAPEKEDGYIRQARLRLAQKDYAGAMEILDKVLEKNPQSGPALMARSEVLAAQQKYDEAIADAQKIQEIMPESADGYFREAKLRELKQEPAVALRLYERAYEMAPDAQNTLSSLIELQIKTGNTAQAEKLLKDILAADPQHAKANDLLGMVYMSQKDYVDAEKAFETQLGINADNSASYTRLASARAAQGDLDGAASAFEDGLKKLPADVRLLIGLAGVRERQKDYEAAIGVYEQVLEQQPGNALSINNVAALIADHRTDEASLARAVEYAELLEKTSQPAFLDTAGWVYYRNGDYAKAVEVLTGVVEKAPDIPVFRYHLGMANLKLGDKDAAREQLTLATGEGAQYEGIEEAREALQGL